MCWLAGRPTPQASYAAAVSSRRPGLVLFPGAGGDRDHHTLRVLAEDLAPRPVARVDFTYRREGRRAPDRAPKLLADVSDGVATARRTHRLAARSVVLGGRSMGGRICSMAVAEGLPAAGLVLLSYPLHPPGRPERLRVEHFPALRVPCLFVSGTRDPFGSPAEFLAETAAIPGPVTHVWLDGQRHDPKGVDEAISAAVKRWIEAL